MTRCERCDRPLAVENDHDGGCTCEQCSAWCWSRFGVPCDPIDWRSRALKAESDLAETARLIEVAALQSRYAGTVVIDPVATVDGVEYRLLRASDNPLLNVWADGDAIHTNPMLTIRLNDAAMKSRAARLETP